VRVSIFAIFRIFNNHPQPDVNVNSITQFCTIYPNFLNLLFMDNNGDTGNDFDQSNEFNFIYSNRKFSV
jgi:hypothetical protein